MKAEDPPVVVEQDFKASVEDVWKALTEVDLMRQWFFDNIPDFRAEVGFETLYDVQSETRIFPHRWRVTDAEAPHIIAYDWAHDGYPGKGHVAFEIISQGPVTKLTLTMTIQEDFPDDIPEFRRESCIGGWNYFIKDRLAQFLSASTD